MKAAKIPLSKAQEEKKRLFDKGVINKEYKAKRDKKFLYIPLIKEIKGIKMVNKVFEKKQRITAKTILKKVLTKEQLKLLPSAYDVIGSILIFELKSELTKKEKVIAQAYLQANKNVETVAKKQGIHHGVYRTQNIKILAGKKTKVTTHKENGIQIELNVEKFYFSPRTATERLRIAKLTKKNEEILVPFAGCAPFPLVMKKQNPTVKITAIELNPTACRYAKKNCKKTDIEVICGDVKKAIPKKTYDRIIMPLPKSAEEFLPTIKKHVKKGTNIHVYAFNLEQTAQDIKKRLEKEHTWLKVQKTVKCGDYGPNIHRYCFDCKAKGI